MTNGLSNDNQTLNDTKDTAFSSLGNKVLVTYFISINWKNIKIPFYILKNKIKKVKKISK